jgi:hypothetical protein
MVGDDLTRGTLGMEKPSVRISPPPWLRSPLRPPALLLLPRAVFAPLRGESSRGPALPPLRGDAGRATRLVFGPRAFRGDAGRADP